MDLDAMLAGAAPARHTDLEGPDSPAAARLYRRITALPLARRALRPRFAASALIGVATAGVAAALVLTLVTAGTATGPAHARLAAWSVTKQPGGLVLITIRDLRDPAGLRRMLQANGVPANVWFPPKDFKPTTSASALPPGCQAPHLSARANAELQGKIIGPALPEPAGPVHAHLGWTMTSGVTDFQHHAVFTIRPSAIPHGIGLYVQAWAARPGMKSGETLSLQTALVQASPRCTGAAYRNTGVAHGHPSGYRVLVTAGPGAAKPATVLAAGARAPGGPVLRLRLGDRNLTVPIAAGPGRAPRSFAVTAVTHAGQQPDTGAAAPVLTVKGTDLTGQPDTGGMVLVTNVANANASGTGFGSFSGGTATFHVQPGTYWAVALFPQFTGKKVTSVRIDVLPQFQVAGNTTVATRAAAATNRVTMTTPRPATTQNLVLTLVRAAPGAPPLLFSPKVESLTQQASGATLWINPVSQAPSYGSLHVFTSAQMTSPARQQVPYAYNLNFASPAGTIGSEHFTVRPSNVATDTETYVQDTSTTANWITTGGTRYQLGTSFLPALFFPIHAPKQQVQYMSASPPMLWQTAYFEYRTVFTGQSTGGQTDALRVLHPGQLTETWNAYPLHPAGNVSFPGSPALVRSSADRAGNTLNLDVTPFSDSQPGHLGAGLAVDDPGTAPQVSGSYAIYQNGTKIASGDAVKATGGFGDVQVHAPLSGKPSLVKFVLTASRASAPYPQSATSHDVWTWHTQPQAGATIPAPWLCGFALGPAAKDRRCAVQPMITLGYHVAGLGLDGATKAGKQSVSITAGHIQLAPQIPVTTATVQMSIDGGKTWQPAEVTSPGAGQFQASFTAAGGAAVSLRVTARDSAGNGLTETILDAYRTAS